LYFFPFWYIIIQSDLRPFAGNREGRRKERIEYG
jgi:hypothetical protein